MKTSKVAPVPSDNEMQAHTSVVLQEMIASAPAENFTLEWLLGSLPKHSFGFILLFLSLIALLPVISVPARLLIILLAVQFIFGYRKPVLPRRLMARPLPSKYLLHLEGRVIPALEHLENVVSPRWPAMLIGTRRFSALVVLLCCAVSLPAPIPLANMPPAIVGILVALGHIEHDGLVLLIGLTAAVVMLIALTAVALQPFM